MKTNNTKLQESITLQRRVIAGYEQAISENKTRRAIFINLGDYKQAAKIEQAINRDEQDLNELNKQLNEMEAELNTTDTTPATMNEVNTVEFSELSHAGQCLNIYLHNTREIYERYTIPAVNRVAKALKAGEYVSNNYELFAKDVQEITPAINTAAAQVRKYDYTTPTAKDIEQVTRNFAAYIVECAKYEVENA